VSSESEAQKDARSGTLTRTPPSGSAPEGARCLGVSRRTVSNPRSLVKG
jgi:hypothetical protein